VKLPKVFFLKKGEYPILIYRDRFGKVEIETEFQTKEDEELLGLIVYDHIFIFPQSTGGKILTIIHELCHWINFKTLDMNWIDELIDTGGYKDEV